VETAKTLLGGARDDGLINQDQEEEILRHLDMEQPANAVCALVGHQFFGSDMDCERCGLDVS
jgi:hypothetical protein